MKCRAIALILALALALPAAAQEGGRLRAGAARIDITPAVDAPLPTAGYPNPQPYKSIHDPLFVRAVVVDDGKNLAAIVSVDLLFVREDFWNRLSERVSRETGVPRESILMAAVHTHGGPNLDKVPPEFQDRWTAWKTRMEDSVVEVVRQAKANLQPARAGFGTGKAYVNTNRIALMADGGWGLGVNPQGVSDKTLGVLKFESLSGEPIALVLNYAVHGTVMGPTNHEITADLPGAAERFVEQHFGGKVVAAWTSAASGDQNAIYGPHGSQFSQLAVLGQIVGEEAIRVAEKIQTSPSARIGAAQRVVTCPGKKAPVDIRLSLLMVNHTALAGVSGEVLTMIGQRLKQESPFAQTLMVTHCNGAAGYIPDDDAYQRPGYEVGSTRLKAGCAESTIVNTFLEMMDGF